jgi:homoserine dehydrogenase
MDVINVGLFGLGVVGSGVVEILRRNRDLIQSRLGAEIRVTKAVTRHPRKARAVSLEGISVSDDPAAILDDPSIHIVVELMGGTELARTVVLKAIESGKAVVTANKALLAECAREIFPRAYAKGTPLGMEASVAGGIPVLRALREGLAGDRILEICGIVNGTCNYILSKMSAEGAAFEAVLAEAQKLGYAEADPTFDVDGHDAAHKLAVLVNLAYGTMVDYRAVYREGIRAVTPLDIDYARQLGFSVKLLAIGKLANGKVEARVHPTLVEREHLLSAVNGVFNAVFLTGDNVDATLFYGRGAGAAPTGGAVVSDLIDISRTLRQGGRARLPPLSVMPPHLRELPVLPIADVVSEYYLRFQVLDRAGVLARMTTVMGNHQISIRSMIQPDQALHPGDPVQVILTTHRAREADVRASLALIEQMDFIQGPTQLLRIERF